MGLFDQTWGLIFASSIFIKPKEYDKTAYSVPEFLEKQLADPLY